MILTGLQWIRVGLSLSPVIVFSFLVTLSSPEVEAQPESINVQNTVITAPLTVIVPITVDVQNAQICVLAVSSGDQSCSQAILNPEQNSYEAVNVDLSDPASVPVVTTARPGVSKTITPPSERAPIINIQNTVVTQPLTITIPIETDTQTAQICVTLLSSGSQSCQQVVLDPETGMYTPVNVDLSQPTPVITPQETTASSPTTPPNQPESINVEHTVATAPITVIVPITGNIQNAQICVSAGSSGTQSCTQLIVNPEETAYTPVSADLTQSETPTVSSTIQQEPPLSAEPATTTTTDTTSDAPIAMDSQQAPSTSPEMTTEPSITDEQTSSESESESSEEISEQGADNNNDIPDDATATEENKEEEQESNSEGSSGGE
jgi:hypothetical protein